MTKVAYLIVIEGGEEHPCRIKDIQPFGKGFTINTTETGKVFDVNLVDLLNHTANYGRIEVRDE